MSAAQKVLQAIQWAETLQNLDAAQAKFGLTPLDKKTIDLFTGCSNTKFGDLKAAKAAFEKALANGAATAEERTSITRTLFGIAAGSGEYQVTVDYGAELADAGTATLSDFANIAQGYFQLKDCNNLGVWVDKVIVASRTAGEAHKENLFLFKL